MALAATTGVDTPDDVIAYVNEAHDGSRTAVLVNLGEQPVPLENTLANMQVIDACYASALENREVSMEEITDIVTRGGASTCGTEVVYRIGVNRTLAATVSKA